MARLGRRYPATPVLKVARLPRFDAVGAGYQSPNLSTTSASVAHTLGSNATALLLGVNFAMTSGTPVFTVSVGGVTIPMLGSPQTTFSGGNYFKGIIFGLLNPPTGAQTVSFSFTGSSGAEITNMNSVSYSGVGSFGAFSAVSGTGLSLAQTVVAKAGQLIFQMFANESTTVAAMTAYNQTARWNVGGSANSYQTLIGDAQGASSVSFTATSSGSSGGWAGLAVPLNPLGA